MSDALLVEGGTVLTVDARDTVRVADILVENGRIVRIAEPGRAEPRPGTRVLSAKGALVVPGFVQTHVHLCQVLFRGFAEDLPLLEWLSEYIWPFEGAHDEESLSASARLGVAELLLGGTTTILDMGTVRHTDVLFGVARDTGIRYVGGKAMMDKGHLRPGGLRETTSESLSSSRTLAKTWHGAVGGRLRYAYAPRFILSCTDELLRAVAKDARAMGCMIHTHASENPGEVEAVREATGKDNIAALADRGIAGKDVILAHCVWLTSEEQRLLVENDTRIAHCPSTNLKLASGIARIPELVAAGLTVGIGADGAPCNNRLSMFTEMRLASLLQKPRLGAEAMPAKRALRMATIDGARALGLDDEIGSIEVGKRADLVVVGTGRPHMVPRTDPATMLVHAAETSDVTDVVVDGQWLVRDGQLAKLPLDGVIDDAERAIDRVLDRAEAPDALRAHRVQAALARAGRR